MLVAWSPLALLPRIAPRVDVSSEVRLVSASPKPEATESLEWGMVDEGGLSRLVFWCQ